MPFIIKAFTDIMSVEVCTDPIVDHSMIDEFDNFHHDVDTKYNYEEYTAPKETTKTTEPEAVCVFRYKPKWMSLNTEDDYNVTLNSIHYVGKHRTKMTFSPMDDEMNMAFFGLVETELEKLCPGTCFVILSTVLSGLEGGGSGDKCTNFSHFKVLMDATPFDYKTNMIDLKKEHMSFVETVYFGLELKEVNTYSHIQKYIETRDSVYAEKYANDIYAGICKLVSDYFHNGTAYLRYAYVHKIHAIPSDYAKCIDKYTLSRELDNQMKRARKPVTPSTLDKHYVFELRWDLERPFRFVKAEFKPIVMTPDMMKYATYFDNIQRSVVREQYTSKRTTSEIAKEVTNIILRYDMKQDVPVGDSIFYSSSLVQLESVTILNEMPIEPIATMFNVPIDDVNAQLLSHKCGLLVTHYNPMVGCITCRFVNPSVYWKFSTYFANKVYNYAYHSRFIDDWYEISVPFYTLWRNQHGAVHQFADLHKNGGKLYFKMYQHFVSLLTTYINQLQFLPEGMDYASMIVSEEEFDAKAIYESQNSMHTRIYQIEDDITNSYKKHTAEFSEKLAKMTDLTPETLTKLVQQFVSESQPKMIDVFEHPHNSIVVISNSVVHRKLYSMKSIPVEVQNHIGMVHKYAVELDDSNKLTVVKQTTTSPDETPSPLFEECLPASTNPIDLMFGYIDVTNVLAYKDDTVVTVRSPCWNGWRTTGLQPLNLDVIPQTTDSKSRNKAQKTIIVQFGMNQSKTVSYNETHNGTVVATNMKHIRMSSTNSKPDFEVRIFPDGHFKVVTDKIKLTDNSHLVMWKGVRTADGKPAFVRLLVPPDAKMDTGDNQKFRVNTCYVDKIYQIRNETKYACENESCSKMGDVVHTETGKCYCSQHTSVLTPCKGLIESMIEAGDLREVPTAYSCVHSPASKFEYRVGETIYESGFTNRSQSCGVGIHAFMDPAYLFSYCFNSVPRDITPTKSASTKDFFIPILLASLHTQVPHLMTYQQQMSSVKNEDEVTWSYKDVPDSAKTVDDSTKTVDDSTKPEPSGTTVRSSSKVVPFVPTATTITNEYGMEDDPDAVTESTAFLKRPKTLTVRPSDITVEEAAVKNFDEPDDPVSKITQPVEVTESSKPKSHWSMSSVMSYIRRRKPQ